MSISVRVTEDRVILSEDSGENGKRQEIGPVCASFKQFISEVKEGKYDNLV